MVEKSVCEAISYLNMVTALPVSLGSPSVCSPKARGPVRPHQLHRPKDGPGVSGSANADLHVPVRIFQRFNTQENRCYLEMRSRGCLNRDYDFFLRIIVQL